MTITIKDLSFLRRKKLHDKAIYAGQPEISLGSGPGIPVEFFGATGDMVFVTDASISSGQASLTALFAGAAASGFTPLDTGKVIVINGAGPSGAPLVSTIIQRLSATNVIIANNASTTVLNVIAYYGTNNTAAFQAAIAALNTAGGGRLLLGLRNYLITSKLILPPIVIADTQVVVIEFVGSIGPMRSNWQSHNPGDGDDVKLPIVGQTIVQLATNVSGQKIMDVNWSPGFQPSGVQVYFNNITCRVPEKTNVMGLDLEHAYSCRLVDVTIEPSARQSILGPPAVGSLGLRLPRVGNGAQIVCRRVGVAGFETGIRHSEHADMDDVWVYRCQSAIMVEAGNHASHYGRVNFHGCPQGFVSESVSPGFDAYLNIDQFNQEDSSIHGGFWNAPTSQINDPGNNLHGTVFHHKVTGFVGQEDGIIKFNGKNLVCQQIGNVQPDGGDLPFACDFTTAPISTTNAPNEENTNQKWMLRLGVTMAVFNSSGVDFRTGTGHCVGRLETLTQENYKLETIVDIDQFQQRTQAGLCLKYINGGIGILGEPSGTLLCVTVEMLPGPVNRLRLFKVVNGTVTTLATSSAVVFAANNKYALRAAYNAGTINIFLDANVATATTLRIGPIVLSGADITTFGKSKQFGLYSMKGTGGDDGLTQFPRFDATAL